MTKSADTHFAGRNHTANQQSSLWALLPGVLRASQEAEHLKLIAGFSVCDLFAHLAPTLATQAFTKGELYLPAILHWTGPALSKGTSPSSSAQGDCLHRFLLYLSSPCSLFLSNTSCVDRLFWISQAHMTFSLSSILCICSLGLRVSHELCFLIFCFSSLFWFWRIWVRKSFFTPRNSLCSQIISSSRPPAFVLMQCLSSITEKSKQCW